MRTLTLFTLLTLFFLPYSAFGAMEGNYGDLTAASTCGRYEVPPAAARGVERSQVLASSQTPKLQNSTITSATVFLQGAQVNRKADVAVAKGRATYVFTGLTKSLDPGSVQVSCKNDDFIILSVSHRINFNEAPLDNPEIDGLYDQIDDLEKRKVRLNAEWQVAKAELEILQLNRTVHSSENGLNPQSLKETVDYQRERRTAISQLRLDINDQLEVIADERETIQKKLAQLGGKRKTTATSEIVVITEADRPTRADFRLSYLVRDAGWTPHYDVRVDDISQPVDLRYRAGVRQNSGENWDNIRLKLSTGDPNKNTEVPKLPTWRLVNGARPPVYRPVAQQPGQSTNSIKTVRGRVTDENGEPLIGASILVLGTTNGTVADFDGFYQLDVPAGASQLQISYIGYNNQTVNIAGTQQDIVLQQDNTALEEVVVLGYARAGRSRSRRQKKSRRKRDDSAPAPTAAPTRPVPVKIERRATTVSFDIELPYSIPSDGKARNVEINRHELPADYAYTAVPKFSLDAFLKASVTGWDRLDLLNGEANLFFEGTYLGKSVLDVSSTNDTLSLSLGVDPNVVITRKETDDYRKRGFLSGKQTDQRAFTIEVRNKKNRPIQLTILDQVPISGDEKIEVDSKVSRPGKLEDETGIITYELELAPSASEKMTFEYEVKYPKGWRIELE